MANKVNLDTSERLDITCRQGDTFSLTVTLKDSAGTAIALSTLKYSFLMQVWGSNSAEPVIGSPNLGKSVKKSFEAFVVDDSGNVTISATAATMKDISSGVYIYDLMSVLPSSTVADTHTTILRGNFTVNPDISKSL